MSNPKHSRRSFLGATATTSLVGATSLVGLSKLAIANKGNPMKVVMNADIAPLVHLIENTPREKLVGMMIQQLQKGVTTNQFVAAMFVASTRINVSPHHVFMMYAALRMSRSIAPEQRLLPLFWALDTLPYHRDEGPRYPPTTISGTMSAETARRELHQAMGNFDAEKAESAIVALSRATNPKAAMSELWPYAGRDDSFIGHRAIALTNSYRVLETIGWEHAEQIFQFVVKQLNGGKRRHPHHRVNWELSHDRFTAVASGWSSKESLQTATLELFNVMREGDDAKACEATFAMLAGGKVTAGSIWDAVYLLGSDFMIRFPNSQGIGTTPLHTNTSANALRFAFDNCGDQRTQLYTLLAAVAWSTHFYGVQVERKTLRPMNITELTPVDVPANAEDVVANVFAQQPKRNYDETQKEILSGNVGPREDMDKVSLMAYSYATKFADHGEFMRSARLLTSLKATQNAHDMKFPVAIFENYELIDARWRPHLLAASTHYLHGIQMVDNPAVQRAKEALG